MSSTPSFAICGAMAVWITALRVALAGRVAVVETVDGQSTAGGNGTVASAGPSDPAGGPPGGASGDAVATST